MAPLLNLFDQTEEMEQPERCRRTLSPHTVAYSGRTCGQPFTFMTFKRASLRFERNLAAA
jgi:hypothetical protein